MRIAIYLGDLSPPSGGAFTFQDDVFRVLMEGDGARRHSLVIYSNLSREQTARYDRADLLWERTRGELPHRLRRWMSACSEFLPFIASSVHYRGSFERSLRRHRVGCGIDYANVLGRWARRCVAGEHTAEDK